MDERRLFTPAQRRALYWVAEGHCEECEATLDPKEWHADHIFPHSKGGLTDVLNGRALCPNCNLKKGDTMLFPYAQLHLNSWPEQPKLRRWQERFVESWKLLCDPKADGQKDFLMAVVPAAGKTTASLKAAHEGLSLGWFGRIVVIVPSRFLVGQWINSAAEKGIALNVVEDYGTGVTEPGDSAGIVTTYQAIAANPEKFRTYSSRVLTFVIGDEIHHCGEKDHLAWGEGMRIAFDHKMTMRLVSSGTPFRSDNARIPFVHYDEKKIEKENGVIEYQLVARADFEYQYGEALRDGVVRDIFFPTWDGKLTWRRGGQEFTHTFQDDLDSQLASDRLKVALDPRGEWLPEVIKNAHERLLTIREDEGHSNAGGLIICKDQEHADRVAEIVEKTTGTKPALAHSDIPQASEIIDTFARGTLPWIVTVRMVSEGVDIKRLRVGIYATTYKTRLYFLQAIARTTRYDNTVPGLAKDGDPVGQPAWFYVPDDPDLQEFMSQIMEISVHHIAEDLNDGAEGGGVDFLPGEQTAFLEGYEFIEGRDAVETGHYYEEKKWSPEQMERARLIFDGIPGFDHIGDAAKALAVERILSKQEEVTPREIIQKEQSIPVVPNGKKPVYQDERDKLKRACAKQTKRLTYLLIKTHPPVNSIGRPILEFNKAIAIITSRVNAYFGARNIGDSSNEDLEKRRQLLAEWIHNIDTDNWDSSLLT
jgi:superfamily II DNA or RNA helicase